MSIEQLQPFELINKFKPSIDRDLAAINLCRRIQPGATFGSRFFALKGIETDMNVVLENLSVVRDPGFVLASMYGELIEEGISSTHEELYHELLMRRIRAGSVVQDEPGSVVSGISFTLSMDPSRKFVRIDSDSSMWRSVRGYVRTFLDAGYSIVDTRYVPVLPNIDYGSRYKENS